MARLSLTLQNSLRKTLITAADQFDAILFWDVADYLPESLVKPLVERLQAMLKPKGHLLAFFHTKDAGAESLYSRHHIVQKDIARTGADSGI